MCRTNRRCDEKWDQASRERYNARRRIVRNGEKAATARADGDADKAAYYDALAASATVQERALDAKISAHEAGSGGGVGKCPECGQFAGSDHSCPGAAFAGSSIRDAEGNLAVVHHGSAKDFDTWDPEFTGNGDDAWGSGFYFTDDRDRAQTYGDHVKSVVLNISNPIVMDGVAETSMDGFYFSAEQSEVVLRRHPDIYRQPGDGDGTNPLGDYAEEYWDKEEWSRAEMDSMISRVSREHFDDVPWSSVEGMFPDGQSAEFRRGVQAATGHDGVIADFKGEGRNVIAWFPEQVHEVGGAGAAPAAAASAPSAGGGAAGGGLKCGECGRWVGSAHECPQVQALEALRSDSAKWRKAWTKAEAEAFDTYGSIDHADINAHLRSGEPLGVEEAVLVRELDKALARAPRAAEERTLYRAFGLSSRRGDRPVDEWVDERFQEGQTVTFEAYTSTSPSYSVAEYFSEARGEYTEGGVVMEIRTTQGGYTGESAENEVLLRRGTSLEVVSSSESFEMEGKKYRRVVLQETASSYAAAPEHPLSSKPPEPMEVSFIRNPVSSTTFTHSQDFGQKIEPSGRYLSESSGVTPQGWESGTVQFNKPLHLAWGESGLYTEADNWKQRLSGYYGKKGKALSKALRADGYDAIVTHEKRGVSEIVDLTSLR